MPLKFHLSLRSDFRKSPWWLAAMQKGALTKRNQNNNTNKNGWQREKNSSVPLLGNGYILTAALCFLSPNCGNSMKQWVYVLPKQVLKFGQTDASWLVWCQITVNVYLKEGKSLVNSTFLLPSLTQFHRRMPGKTNVNFCILVRFQRSSQEHFLLSCSFCDCFCRLFFGVEHSTGICSYGLTRWARMWLDLQA